MSQPTQAQAQEQPGLFGDGPVETTNAHRTKLHPMASRLMLWTLEGLENGLPGPLKLVPKREIPCLYPFEPREQQRCSPVEPRLLPLDRGCLTICDGGQKAQLAWRRRSTRLDSGPHLGALGSWIFRLVIIHHQQSTTTRDVSRLGLENMDASRNLDRSSGREREQVARAQAP